MPPVERAERGILSLERRPAEPVTRWSRQRQNGECESEVQTTTMEKPTSTWSFDQGSLTVHHLGKTVSLGRYATHEFAAKAAAVYFAKHGGRCGLPQSRRAAAKPRRSGCSF
jgi:hypothetical protein